MSEQSKVSFQVPQTESIDEFRQIMRETLQSMRTAVNIQAAELERQVRCNARPTIKGKMTWFKTVWRGIHFVVEADGTIQGFQFGRAITNKIAL